MFILYSTLRDTRCMNIGRPKTNKFFGLLSCQEYFVERQLIDVEASKVVHNVRGLRMYACVERNATVRSCYGQWCLRFLPAH